MGQNFTSEKHKLELGKHNWHAASNEIHVSLSAGRKAAASVSILLHKADRLKVLEDVPDKATYNAERDTIKTSLEDPKR